MRKSLTLLLVFFILSVGALIFAHGWVNKAQDVVIIDETVLYGDKTAAEGLRIDCNTHCDYHLFWNTAYTVGEKPVIETVFDFSQAQRRAAYVHDFIGLMVDGSFSGYDTSSSSGIDMENQSAPVWDVARRTEPGEKHTEVVYFKDYYDYYPIGVGFDMPGGGFAGADEVQAVFNEYFKIPVWPEHKLIITVEKDAAGKARSISRSSVEDHDVYLDTRSVLTDTGCFFTLAIRTTTGLLLDTSRIPGGYGVYYIPFNETSDAPNTFMNQLSTVYPVDETAAEIISLQTTVDKSRLLLVTKEDGAYMLTVIDAVTMEQLQKMKLFDVTEDMSFDTIYTYDDYIVPYASNGRFLVMTENDKGVYEIQISAELGEAKSLRYSPSLSAPVMDFDGRRLVVSNFQTTVDYHYSNVACGFYLAVFDQSGLIYYGQYDHSLDKSPGMDYSGNCLPSDQNPLTVAWSS